jgi:hypothetical protein
MDSNTTGTKEWYRFEMIHLYMYMYRYRHRYRCLLSHMILASNCNTQALTFSWIWRRNHRSYLLSKHRLRSMHSRIRWSLVFTCKKTI